MRHFLEQFECESVARRSFLLRAPGDEANINVAPYLLDLADLHDQNVSQGKIAEYNQFFHLGTRLSICRPCHSFFNPINILSLQSFISLSYFYLECPHDKFQCDNGQCISSYHKCDGFTHCSDGSDEDDCGK